MIERDAGGAEAGATVAAVDLGSNSFHMIVARKRRGYLQIIDRLREPVRLAAGLEAGSRLTPAAEERALACLERFGQRLRELGSDAVRAVGTNTLRRAENSRDFLVRAELALGHAIEIVSGFEEARLIYLGVAHSLADDGRRRLVVDIGGSSTELIVGEGFQPQLLKSLNVGSVALTEACFPGGTLARRCWQRAQLAAAMELEPMARRLRATGWQRVVGASGTIQAAERVLAEAGWSESGITLPGLYRLREAMIRAGHVDKLDLKGLSAERAQVFAGGVAILLALFEALGIVSMEAADGALREGVLYDLAGYARHEEVQASTVASLMARYHVDREQAERVTATCEQLLAQLERQGWGPGEGRLHRMLAWAAQLHEIGLDISHKQYHKHGAYVLQHADMAGFSREEQHILAVLVQGHRRKYPARRLKELPARLQAAVAQLVVVLRLAVLLHRGRASEPLPPIELQAKGDALELRFPDGWLAEHSLLQADLEEEAAHLKSARLRLSFG